MNKWTVISTDNDEYQLSAIVVDEKYVMASLEFKLDGEHIDTWDNEKFLYEEVYPYLKGEKENYELDKTFSFIKKEILEIFEEAVRIGFFKELQK